MPVSSHTDKVFDELAGSVLGGKVSTKAEAGPAASATELYGYGEDEPGGEGTLMFSEWLDRFSLYESHPEKAGLELHHPDFPVTVYSQEDWPEEVRHLIPDLKEFDSYLPDVPAMYAAMRTLEFGDNLRLIGESGGGKSVMSKAIAAATGRPFARVNCKAQMTRDDLVGAVSLTVEDGVSVTEMVKSPLLMVFEHGGICNVDEFSRAPSGVNMELQAPLESNSVWVVPELETPIIKRNDRTLWVVSDNTAGVGDGLDKYGSSMVQDVSTLNRFPITLVVNYLKPRDEAIVLAARHPTIDATEVEKVIKFAGLVRQAFSRGEVALPFSARTTDNVCRYLRAFGDIRLVLESTYINGLGDEAAQAAVRAMISSVWGR